MSTRFSKMIFLIKAKNKKKYFVLGVSKVLSEGVNLFSNPGKKKLKILHSPVKPSDPGL